MTKRYIERKNHELREKINKILEENKKLKRKVNYDDLTGLLRRDKFDEVLNKLMKRSDRLNSPLSYILIDIDKFKSINDKYGHDKGDEVLIDVADTIKETVRDTDVLCRDFVGRYGGEEMSVFLTGTDQYGARIVGERIRRSIEEKFKDEEIKVTVSAGISTYSPKGDPKEKYTKEIETLAKKADQGLYKAKERGRNKVVS